MTQPINILFDGPPSHKSGRFVEVETDDGKSINAGEWAEREDGYWVLRITSLPNKSTQQGVKADRANYAICPNCGDRILKPGHCYNPHCKAPGTSL